MIDCHPRRRVLAALACAGLVPVVPSAWSQASAYPDRPVRIVVPYSPGGTTDAGARLVAAKITESTGKSFFVENRPGATGTVGTGQVAKSAPDGYTLMANDTTYTLLPNLFRNLPWDHASDLEPITTLMTTPVVLLVPANSKYTTLQQLVDDARANPGKLNFGTGGAGSSPHFAAELFKKQAGISMTHIPFKGGGDALLGLISNQIDLSFDAPPTAIPSVQGGKVRVLAVTGSKRVGALPGVPTFAEAGMPGYQVTLWFGMVAPKGTPKEVIAKVHGEVRKALATPEVRDRIATQGGEPGGIPPEEFVKLIQDDTKRWAQVARDIGIKPE